MTYSDQVTAAWLETRAFLDPASLVKITAQNGQSAQVVATNFLESNILKETTYDAKLPAAVEILRADFVRLAIQDRSKVTVAGHVLTVIIIADDPVDPVLTLTLTAFAN